MSDIARHRRHIVVEWQDSLDSLREEWRTLALRSKNIFATWEWISIWWRHVGHGELMLARAREAGDDASIAIVPLHLSKVRGLRLIRFAGHGVADQLGPICSMHDPRAVPALRSVLTDIVQDWHIFVGEYLPGDEGWSRALDCRLLQRRASPLLTLHDTDWDKFLASHSSNFRQQIRRRERKLAREHGVRFRLTTDASTLNDDLDVLFRLHTARWGRAAGAFGSWEAFHREFAACALDRGWLRLWLLELGGEPVAAWYGFRYSGREYYYQAGRDPNWDHGSVGSVLLAHTIRSAIQDEMIEYRFLRGSEGYKYRFATGDPGLETIALSRGIAGRGALLLGNSASKLGPLRRALKRYGLP